MLEFVYSDLVPARRDPANGRASCLHPAWALVLGGASCVWDDVLTWETTYGKQWDGLVVAANDIGSHWPRDLDHWVSLHPEKFDRWRALRAKHEFSNGYKTWGRAERPAIIDYALKAWAGGSSGLLALQVALTIGCTHVILCGIPMTQTPHFSETQEKFHEYWVAANAHWKSWAEIRGRLGNHVRSMSGRTQEMLGAPTLDWLRAPP